MLYEPAQFEPLTDEPWDPGHVEDAIATIVADAEAAFDPASLWPAHEWDGLGGAAAAEDSLRRCVLREEIARIGRAAKDGATTSSIGPRSPWHE